MSQRLLVLFMLGSPSLAFAYVGPGAGITMLGSLWGLIIAVVLVIAGLLFLPFKLMRNKARARKAAKAEKEQLVTDTGKSSQSEEE